MKALISVDKFKDAIGRMVAIVDRKTTRPILANCLVDFKDGNAVFIATDLEVAAKISIPAQVQEEGKFCINPKSLFDILRELPNEELKLEIGEGDTLLKINLNQIKFSLLISSTDEYPPINFSTFTHGFSLKSGELKKIIDKTSHAISNDETRIFLNGIFFQVENDNLKAVATDGYRLASIELTGFNLESDRLKEGFILPRKGVQELKKSLDFISPELILEIQLDENFIYISTPDGIQMAIRLIAREFPKYKSLIPAKTSFRMEIDREKFVNAIKRVKVLANEKTSGIKISLKQDQVQISSTHPSLGEASETIPARYEGKSFDIGFSAKYLIDSFNSIDTNELSLEFNNELSPVILKSKEMPEYFGVIMPLRLQY